MRELPQRSEPAVSPSDSCHLHAPNVVDDTTHAPSVVDCLPDAPFVLAQLTSRLQMPATPVRKTAAKNDPTLKPALQRNLIDHVLAEPKMVSSSELLTFVHLWEQQYKKKYFPDAEWPALTLANLEDWIGDLSVTGEVTRLQLGGARQPVVWIATELVPVAEILGFTQGRKLLPTKQQEMVSIAAATTVTHTSCSRRLCLFSSSASLVREKLQSRKPCWNCSTTSGTSVTSV